MSYFKSGKGSPYMCYTPTHLARMQPPRSVARAVHFQDPTLRPIGDPACASVAAATRDPKSCARFDGKGGVTCYGRVDSYVNCGSNDDLPIAIDCVLKRDATKDQPINYRDVELPAGRLCDQLRAEQTAHFAATLREAA